MNDESRVLAVLEQDRWTTQADVRTRAQMDTARCGLALYRLADVGQVESSALRCVVGKRGRNIALWRRRAVVARMVA